MLPSASIKLISIHVSFSGQGATAEPGGGLSPWRATACPTSAGDGSPSRLSSSGIELLSPTLRAIGLFFLQVRQRRIFHSPQSRESRFVVPVSHDFRRPGQFC